MKEAGYWTAIKRFATGVDQAVLFSILFWGYQAVTGAIGLIITPIFFSGKIQGYFYTFSSLLGSIGLIELGLLIVILNTASHEWAFLKLNEKGYIEGDQYALSRLVSLGRKVFVWFGWAALLFLVVMATVGYLFFEFNSKDSNISWRGPWISTIILASLSFWTMPFLVVLEGCGQMAKVYRYRLWLGVTGTASMWGCMASGMELWAVPVTSLVSLLGVLWILFNRFKHFWSPFFSPPRSEVVNWKTEMWPMQWRLAVSYIGGFAACNLYNPVIFHFHGAAEAGRMGMTLQMVSMLQGVGMSFGQARAPQFGVLIAQRKYVELDRLFYRTTALSVFIMVLGGMAMMALIFFVRYKGFVLGQRLLPPLPAVLLILYALLMQVSYCQSFYLRAHKKEPLMWLSLTAGLLQGALIYWWGAKYGPMGQAVASLVVVAVVVIPWETWLFEHARKHWRG